LPHTYTAEASRTLYFCGCKHTAGAPLCDCAHNGL
jgi:CDGSH-type Zn-finger protein